MRDLVVGGRALLLYDPAEGLWHERFLVAKVASSKWAVISPTLDVFIEDLLDPDVQTYLCGSRGGAPKELVGKKLYRFDPRDLDNLDDYIAEGERLAVREKARLLAAAPPPIADRPAPRAPPAAAAPDVPARAARRRRANTPAAAALPADGGDTPRGEAPQPDDVWTVMESRVGFTKGDVVDLASMLPSVYELHGDHGLLRVGPTWIAIALLDTFEDVAPRAAPVADTRVLEWKVPSATGVTRLFGAAAEAFSEVPAGDHWSVEGPKTAAWLYQRIAEQGPGPAHRHFWWRSVLKVSASDNGVDDHLFLSELLETAACEDQLSCVNSQVVEKVARRLQSWEEVYAQQLRVAAAGEGSC